MESVYDHKEIAPVALVFFNRPHSLKQVFEEVKKAKPSQLFLIQDGPRRDNEDEVKIEECRQIVEKIDWDCEVFRNYSDVNLGCGRRPFSGIEWVFSHVDRAIILEDDCIPSQSFFYFCSELLEHYLYDNRIFMITGVNMELSSNVLDSYFFGYSGTNWGWATWRRSWENIDYEMNVVKDEYTANLLKQKMQNISGNKGLKEYEMLIKTNERTSSGENISYWDVQFQAIRYLQNQLSIIPTKNLITNIGVGEDATHSTLTYQSKKKMNFFFNDRYDIDFPLNHPKYVIQNLEYDKKVDGKINPNLMEKINYKLIKALQYRSKKNGE